MPWLALIFIVLPIAEIWLLFEVASRIGGWWTVAAVLGLAAVGAAFARWRGAAMSRRISTELEAGRAPTRQVMEGALIALAVVLFLIPGFLSDVIALLCLIPWTRQLILHVARAQLARAQAEGRASVVTTFFTGMADGMADVKDVPPEDVEVRTTTRPSLRNGKP